MFGNSLAQKVAQSSGEMNLVGAIKVFIALLWDMHPIFISLIIIFILGKVIIKKRNQKRLKMLRDRGLCTDYYYYMEAWRN